MSAPWRLGGYHGRTSVELLEGDRLIGTMVVRRLTIDAPARYETQECADGWARARVAAAAPELVEALEQLSDLFAYDGEGASERFDRLAAMFRKDTGYTMPGKDQPASGVVARADRDNLAAIYDAWYAAKITRARAALAKVRGS